MQGFRVGFLDVHRSDDLPEDGPPAHIALIDGKRGIERQDIIDFCEHNGVEHQLMMSYGDDPCSDHVQYYLYLVPTNSAIGAVTLKIGFGDLDDVIEEFDEDDVLATVGP